MRRLLKALAVSAVSGLVLVMETSSASALTRDTIRPVPPQAGAPDTPRTAQFSASVGALTQAEIVVVSGQPLPTGLEARIDRLPGVTATAIADAGRVEVNGVFANVIGVNVPLPSALLAASTAKSAGLWRGIAGGGIVVSGKLARQDPAAQGHSLHVAGAATALLPVAGSAEFGIPGVDAIVSATVAQRVGIPAGNAIIVGATNDRLASLFGAIQEAVPSSAAVVSLVARSSAQPVDQSIPPGRTGQADAAAHGQGMSPAQVRAVLAAATSRVGMPYVWGGDGPQEFDCSGLVQWSMAQAGVAMPRVASDQALTGPMVPLSQLQPGDLLFYREDSGAPHVISHVAIYIGNKQMLQAPAPGLDVEIVPADFGIEFARAVRISKIGRASRPGLLTKPPGMTTVEPSAGRSAHCPAKHGAVEWAAVLAPAARSERHQGPSAPN